MANTISMIRTALAIIVISLLFLPSPAVYWLCFVLTGIVILMDGLDGYIARRRGESSKIGAVLDIMGDRIVENVYWIAFAVLGWLPLWVPLVIVIRGTVTDGLRSVALEQGYTAFGEHSMMQSRLGKYLVASRFSRFAYALSKAVAFAFLIVAHIPEAQAPFYHVVGIIGYLSGYSAVALCLIRGIPVIIESKRFFPGMR